MCNHKFITTYDIEYPKYRKKRHRFITIHEYNVCQLCNCCTEQNYDADINNIDDINKYHINIVRFYNIPFQRSPKYVLRVEQPGHVHIFNTEWPRKCTKCGSYEVCHRCTYDKTIWEPLFPNEYFLNRNPNILLIERKVCRRCKYPKWNYIGPKVIISTKDCKLMTKYNINIQQYLKIPVVSEKELYKISQSDPNSQFVSADVKYINNILTDSETVDNIINDNTRNDDKSDDIVSNDSDYIFGDTQDEYITGCFD